MSVITAKTPPTRPPTARSGKSVMRTQRNSPVALRSRRSNETFAPPNARVDVLVHFGERAAGDQLLDAAAEQVVGRDADPVAERLVREADLELPVEVDDRRADAVGDEAQPVLAPAGLELQPLQLVDVGISDEEAADVAVRSTIGVVVDANPHRRPARRR